jgi:DNA-binding NarL/FixJ family response regulator
MPLCLILSDDMIDGSRIGGHAKALGFEVLIARTQTQALTLLEKLPTAVLVDLHNRTLEPASLVSAVGKISPKPLIVAFGSHVDAQRLKAARAAACDLVLPRSAFFEDLDGNLLKWCQPAVS